MKIRAIELMNVRRFAGSRARISGIGNGLTVLSEPNEFGKSTFFDALHALFFERHRSTKSSVKALQPHAGGAPEVELVIELPEGLFRVRKRWISRATAQIFDARNRLVAQDDEAEAWIDRLLGHGLAGPSGLLWVRQGTSGVESTGTTAAEKTERDQALSTRRDLLSSVAGEIELMTGGRRMDTVLDRVDQQLDRLATSRLRPKTAGDWARAAEEVAALSASRDALALNASRLSDDLARRADVLRNLRHLVDPQADQARQAALADARLAHQAASDHAQRIDEARRAAKLAEMTAAKTEGEMQHLAMLANRLSLAQSAWDRARAVSDDAARTAQARQDDDSSAATALAEAQKACQQLRQRLEAVQKARTAALARKRADQLSRTLDHAQQQRETVEAARAAAALVLTTETALQAAEIAQSDRDLLAMQIAAQRVSVDFTYSGPQRALRDGAAVAQGAQPLFSRTRFDLPGLGALVVDPGQLLSNPQAELAEGEALLAKRLADCGVVDLAEARRTLAEARRLSQEIRTANAILQQIAPDGIDALRLELTRLRAEAVAAPTDDDGDALAGALAKAEAAETAARLRATELHARAIATGQTQAATWADRVSAERALAAAQKDTGDAAALAARLAAMQSAQAGLVGAASAAQEQLAQLERSAPDLATASARLARAQSAAALASTERERLQTDLATLNGSIGALADEGIEEHLDEVVGQLTSAQARAARFETEVNTLSRLRSALDDARRQARDAYFGPVLRELEPLLWILHPGARLKIDDQTLLPVALTRDGQVEPLDILSGGTQEQLAVLTRLAFARLFAEAGRSVPVILDDALVHSDDDRIEAMFTALHRVAMDQQILVLTCRQRAFASLGGDRVHAEITPL